MDYVKIGPKLLDCVKEMTVLAEKITERIPTGQQDPKLIPVDVFFFFFLNRTVKAGKSVTLLTENKLYEDALAIGRVVLEGRYYLHGFLNDDSLANKWMSFYVREKYAEELESSGKDAANKLLDGFTPTIVARAKSEFDFENVGKRQEWYKYPRLRELVRDLGKTYEFDEKWYNTIYRSYSKVTHWTPAGIIDSELYVGAALSTTFLCLFEMSNAANNEFGLSFGDDLVKMRSRFVSYFSSHRMVVS